MKPITPISTNTELTEFLIWHRKKYGIAFNDLELECEFRKTQESLKKEINPINIITTVFICYNLNVALRLAKTRKRQIVQARQVSASLLKELCMDLSLQSIGDYFNRDHATVMHAIKAVNNLRFEFTEMRDFYETLRNGIENGIDLRYLKVPPRLIKPATFYLSKVRTKEYTLKRAELKNEASNAIIQNGVSDYLNEFDRERKISKYKEEFIGRI